MASIILAAMLLQSPLTAQVTRTGRSVGTAGAGSAAMFGVQAVGWNPANLGLSANPGLSITSLSFETSIANNSFTPTYISDTFVEGEVLDSLTKAEIIGKLKADDFKIYPHLTAPVFGVSVGKYAFNLDSHTYVQLRMPPDIFRMALTGPVVDEAYDIGAVEGEAYSYWTGSISAAKPLTPPSFLSELSLGATFKYIGGVGYGTLDKHNGEILITHEHIGVSGDYTLLYSTAGDGVGLDLAAAGWIKKFDLYCGVTFGNIIGSVNWTGVEAKDFSFELDEDGIDMERLTDEEYLKNLFSDSTVTRDAADVRMPLPRYLLFSGGRSFSEGRVKTMMSWYQGLNESAAQSRTPRISLGTELNYVPVLPLRLGFALGGLAGTEFTTGLGIKLPGYQLNVGVSWQRGLFLGAEGFSIAITNYFGAAAVW